MAIQRLTLGEVLALLGGAGFSATGRDFVGGLLDTSGVSNEALFGDVENKYPTSQMSVNLGPAEHNASIKRRTAQFASRMQTLKEHNDALTKFLKPGQKPSERIEAIKKGKEAEKKLESFWDDRTPRVPYTPSSSAVQKIRITPDNRVQVQWRTSNKWYDFLPQTDSFTAAQAFHDLVTAPSIGRAVMPFKRKGIALKFKKKPGVEYSWWNRAYYDQSKAR